MDERRLKYLYAALAVVFGLPGALLGGIVALVGVYGGLTQENRLLSRLLMVLLGAVGTVGIVVWLRISVDFLLHGRPGLRAVSRIGWWGLLLGALVALSIAVLGVVVGLTERAEGFGLLLFGPPLLVPAAMLLWLKRRP
ncbi:hypothetical protein SMSKK35_2828 [Stenotrophomonas maltophilia SKK35]|uniref:Transmembrane protein n=1 Tax=Stenotrophomonas maltophilia TaxID=40324 RepID=A0AAJ2JA50_STEMA|nr:MULTISPECIES: hypothetical protein [Stenotrophomonas]CCP09713.1 hypothetical protein SMSKK35_2828 [Stenotrophomonas maltophilia SKK35]MBH1363895.1 hypothetical protein [Stenotrophomonas maltophilia]MDQ7280681.1 hypothetical protein [Stenotrophomonas sp. Sm6012]MDT3466565.1 hypothetical protein [Stenotrophomonas maltophilia]HDS1123557.1 hypothetical protein [Stenotrophomonas maltophilia]